MQKMLQFCFQNYFTLTIYIIIRIKFGISGDSKTSEVAFSDILTENNNTHFQRSCYELQKSGVGVCNKLDKVISGVWPIEKEIYEFKFIGVKHLSSGELSGISLHILHLDDPDITVDENAFRDMVKLFRFNVKRSNIEIIPDFRFVKDSIRAINIHSSPLKSLEGKHLQNLTLVTYLWFVNCSLRFIDPDVFKGTENVKELDLSKNLLTSIPPNLLDPMKNLSVFTVNENNLLQVDNVFSITQPKSINLFRNNIRAVDFSAKKAKNEENPVILVDHLSRQISSEEDSEELIMCGYNTINFLNIDLSYNLIENFSTHYEAIDDCDHNELILFDINDLNLIGNKLKYLKGNFWYMKIYELKVAENQIQYLTDEDFRLLHGTRDLQLQGNQIQWIGTHAFKNIRTDLMYLDLSFNSITYLNGSVRHLSDLMKLNLTSNNIQTFARYEFEGLDSLSELYLNGNKIKAFSQCDELPNFYIRHSNVVAINTDQMCESSVVKIRKDRIYLDVIDLSLSGNKLKLLKENFWCMKIFALNVAENQIQYLTDEDFKYLDGTNNLELQGNQIQWIGTHTFKSLRKHLSYLDLSFNLLTYLNGSVRHLYNLNELKLACNNIQSLERYEFEGLVQMAKLDLSNNKIKVLWQHQDLPYLETSDIRDKEIETIRKRDSDYFETTRPQPIRSKQKYLNGKFLQRVLELKMAENQIQYLTDKYFESFERAETLIFQGNQIQWIGTQTFKSLKMHLNQLDLSFNSISCLNGSMRNMSHLLMLNLTSNNIQFFAKDEFDGAVRLCCLYLNNNKIKVLWQFEKLHYLEILDLRNNEIETIGIDQVPKKSNARPIAYGNVIMNLRGNNLKCDCRIFQFAVSLIISDFIETDINVCLDSDFKNNKKNNLSRTEVCSYECTNDGNDYFMSAECSSKNLSYAPQFLRRNSSQVESNKTTAVDERYPLIVKQNVYPSLKIEDKILGINLDSNSLASFQDIQLPRNLIQLFLSNNKLRRLPNSVFDNQKNLKHVSLSGNPWICDCSTFKFKEWLTSNLGIIHDIDNVRCGINEESDSSLNGKVIWKLNSTDLCPVPPNVDLILPVSLVVLSLLTFCLATKVLYTKYSLNIKVFLYSRGLTFVKEKDIDDDKDFDAFLSFSHEDGEIVTKEIISAIEKNDPNIRLCIHYRHFVPGEFIYNNIIRAVQSSKRTVLFLSKNFLQSEWCLVEFRTAHMQTLEDKVHRIIIIKFGDLPKVIDPAIKAYLDNTTYLTWGEKNFWNKLFYVLPAGRNERNFSQDL